MRRSVTTLLALVLAVATGCSAAPPAPSPPRDAPSASPPPVSLGPGPTARPGQLMERAMEHMGELQRIADEAGGNRAHGTPGYAASVDYVVAALGRAGYEARRDERSAVVESEGEASLSVVQGTPVELGTVNPVVRAPNTATGGITAAVVPARTSVGCQDDDYADARGAIVLVERGLCRFGVKSRAAGAAGALGMIIYNTSGEGDLRGELDSSEGAVPTVGISDGAGVALRSAIEAGDLVARLSVEARYESLEVVNVLAQAPGAADGPVLLLGAHLDSVAAGPGINDNGSGVAVALAVAEELGRAGRARGLRLAFWDAEELGLVGSGAYVKDLDQGALDALLGYLNLDMVASPNGVVGVYGDGPARKAVEDGLRAAGSDYVPLALPGASDHAWFEARGISVGGVYTGAGEALTGPEAEVFGGDAGEPRDPCYHQACDRLDAVDTPAVRERLAVIAEATLLGVERLLATR